MSRVFRAENKACTPVFWPGPGKRDAIEDPRASLARAKEEAQRLLGEAKDEAQAISQRERERGYQEGYREGFSSSQSHFQSMLDEAEDALEAAKASYQDMLKQSEPILLALVLETAQKVVGKNLKARPELVLDMLRAGMKPLQDETEFTICVRPEVASLVKNAALEIAPGSGGLSYDVVSDEAIGDGVLVRTPHGFVDATVNAQIRNIAGALAEARRRGLEVSAT